jgi:hypothetical protein
VAIQYGRANNPVSINADHMNIVKFENNKDNYFVTVRELLQRWGVHTISGKNQYVRLLDLAIRQAV